MRRKLLYGKMIGVLAVSMILFMAVGVAEEERTDATGQWTYVLEDGGATITGYVEELSGDLVIPSELDGHPVTSIGEWAFKDCISLTGLTIGSNVASIGDLAFFACESLISVTLPDSVTSIGSLAFADCFSLSSVTIPAGVTNISNDAFQISPELAGFHAKVTLTLYVEKGSYAEQYAEANNLSYVYGVAVKKKTDATGQWTYVLEDSGATITAYLQKRPGDNVIIPGELDGHAVTGIGKAAFAMRFRILTRVTIPESVTNIQADSFGELSLATVKVAPKNPVFEDIKGVLIDKQQKMLVFFPPNKKDTRYTIPKGVLLIGDRAFYQCQNLNRVTIPVGVTSIGSEAFRDCYWLTNATIHKARIGESAFEGCANLTLVSIKEGVPLIGERAFARCTNLTSVTIPGSVAGIGPSAFYGCDRLTSVTIKEGVNHIGEEAFRGCRNLASVTIPSSVVSIGDDAFRGCSNFYFCLTVKEGSFAEQYAKENNIPYVLAKK